MLLINKVGHRQLHIVRDFIRNEMALKYFCSCEMLSSCIDYNRVLNSPNIDVTPRKVLLLWKILEKEFCLGTINGL